MSCQKYGRSPPFVHGIYSTPITWHETMNDLPADPAIRERYEFWSFGYLTGRRLLTWRQSCDAPLLVCRIIVRRGEPAAASSPWREQHGRLIGKKMATQHGGDAEWDRICTVPIAQVDLTSEARDLVCRIIYYEPVPDVKKIIVCATPHRGIPIADYSVANALAHLIQMLVQPSRISQHILKNNFWRTSSLF
jgi:hypothetical protein